VEDLIQFELSKKYLDRFKKAIQESDENFIKQSLAGVKFCTH